MIINLLYKQTTRDIILSNIFLQIRWQATQIYVQGEGRAREAVAQL